MTIRSVSSGTAAWSTRTTSTRTTFARTSESWPKLFLIQLTVLILIECFQGRDRTKGILIAIGGFAVIVVMYLIAVS